MDHDKIEENINKVFNIDTVNEEEESKELVVSESKGMVIENDIDTDLSNRQEELGVLLKNSQEIVDVAKEGVMTWGKPTNIMAYAKLLDSTVNVINSLKAVNEKRHSIKEKEEKMDDGKKVQNNFIISGDSREILDVIEKAMKK